MAELNMVGYATEPIAAMPIEMEREVLSCHACGLVQYRTRTGKCRRCVRTLPPKLALPALNAEPEPTQPLQNTSARTIRRLQRRSSQDWVNLKAVRNVGRKIQQFREAQGLTQNELQDKSNVSRSYLSRIEIGL